MWPGSSWSPVLGGLDLDHDSDGDGDDGDGDDSGGDDGGGEHADDEQQY